MLWSMSYISLSYPFFKQWTPATTIFLTNDGFSLWPTLGIQNRCLHWTAHKALGQTSMQLWWHVREITSSRLMFFLTTFVHHCASTLQGLYLVYMADSFGPLSDWSALIHNCQTSIFVEPGMLGLAVWSKFSLPWDLFPCYVTWPTWPPFEVANKRGSRIWRIHQIL